MELLYFIVGGICVIVLNNAWRILKIKNEHIKLSLDVDDLESEVDRLSLGISEDINKLKSQISSITHKLKEDSYQDLSGINKQLLELNKFSNAMNNRFGDSIKYSEKQLSGVFSEIQQLKNNIKALNQDPNIINR